MTLTFSVPSMLKDLNDFELIFVRRFNVMLQHVDVLPESFLHMIDFEMVKGERSLELAKFHCSTISREFNIIE